MVWWGYDNSNDDCASGHFDPFQYRNTIFLTGNIQGAIDYRIPFANSFPTRFLWEDFENEVRESWKAYTEAREKESREMMEGVERRKKKRLDIIESIKSKLTAEELDYVRFAGDGGDGFFAARINYENYRRAEKTMYSIAAENKRGNN